MAKTTLTAEQQAKVKDARKAAAIENGVRAKIARRTLKAELKRDKEEAKQQAKDAETKAKSHATMARNLWDADGDGDIDELDAEIISAYVATTQGWVSSGEDTWLRHVEMAENPEVYMLTQGGTVQVNGEDVNLDPDNPDAVAAFTKLHKDQADIWRAALDAAQEELDELVPVLEDEAKGTSDLVAADRQLDTDDVEPTPQPPKEKK